MFDNYIPALQGMTSEEIGGVLDYAARIKQATTIFGTKREEVLLFEDPILVPEDVAFETLNSWKLHMIENAGTLEGRAKVGAMSIWYLSLVACQIAELRPSGRRLWRELERGFPHCVEFSPDADCVKGVEAKRT